MGRPRTIDREQLLDAAERVVSAGSAAALSFGSVAAAAGVAKATVQSVFGSREAMIDAMLGRWLEQERKRFEAAAGPRPSARDRIRAHIQTTEEEDGGRVATLLAALAGSGEQSASTASWYASRVGELAARTRAQRRMRIAFLAAEGAFYMRHLAGFALSDAVWSDIFQDLRAFVSDDE